MSRIVYVNLTTETVEEKEYSDALSQYYGRGLASYLVKENLPPHVGRHSAENSLILVPGLLTGTFAPSTGRLIIAAKKAQDSGIQYLNLAGPFSQKMACLGIVSIVIKGKNLEDVDVPAVLSFDEAGAQILKVPCLKEREISETISYIRNNIGRGKDTAAIGIGSAGEHLLPIASVFTTYPEGNPLFNCARGGMGDIFGSKGLKAVAVTTKSNFTSRVVNVDEMEKASKSLARIIIDHPVCGGALPAYGSITLMKMMKSNELNLSSIKATPQSKIISEDQSVNPSKEGSRRINRTCAPLCVVGCLNRHVHAKETLFSSPAESEVSAALEDFGIEDAEFASRFNRIAFEQGIDSVEFLFCCALYYKIKDIKVGKIELLAALNEVKELTNLGRILASRTEGLYRLYQDHTELLPMVTQPSIAEEHSFNIKLSFKVTGCEDLEDKQYLYANMLTLENLGFCLFTSFAIIESREAMDLLAVLFHSKTGRKVEAKNLIEYAVHCLKVEEDYEKIAKLLSLQKGIPEFVKVLHRYFGKGVHE
ncbi:hypothetical protein JCM17380_17940 [Desulfosporosinus burensis]